MSNLRSKCCQAPPKFQTGVHSHTTYRGESADTTHHGTCSKCGKSAWFNYVPESPTGRKALEESEKACARNS